MRLLGASRLQDQCPIGLERHEWVTKEGTMAPEIDRVLNQANAGWRDFLRKIITGAVFAPPLLVSCKLDGPSMAEALDSSSADMCRVTNVTGPFTSIGYDFSG